MGLRSILPPGRPQQAWCLYDWACSAFATSAVAALLPVYFAKSVVPEGGVTLSAGQWSWHLEAASLWAYTVSFSLAVTASTAPFLGAISDRAEKKKTFFLAFAYLGAVASVFLYGAQSGAVFYTLFCFALANIGFLASEVFYNAFLPELAPPQKLDRLSGLGFAWGYAGGGLLLAAHLAFLTFHRQVGIPDKALAARLCLLSVGIWWAVFTLPAVRWLPAGTPSKGLPGFAAARSGIAGVWATLKHIRSRRSVFLFLLAFFLYNDGIQTVIGMASIYGATTLNLSMNSLLGALLLTQWVAFPGAVLLSRLAESYGTRRILMIALAIWCGIIFYAYRMQHAWEFWVLAGAVGLILGGSQALSRSLYSHMIPAGRSSEFFGFYSIGSKFSAVLGPFLFGLIVDVTGSGRQAVLSVLAFFIAGALVLWMVPDEKEDAGGPEGSGASSPGGR
jgi:UMF1 family MFS transporter